MTDQEAVPPWLAEDEPFDEDQSRTQVASVLTVLDELPRSQAGGPCRVLELGCGGGRVLIPLAAAGHLVTGIDYSDASLERCRERSHPYQDRVELILADFCRDSWPKVTNGNARSAGYDAILLLGNTLMTLTETDDAVSLFTRAADYLATHGVFLIDDIAGCFWPELTEGHWQSGLNEDGGIQLIWHPRDTLFTIRLGEQVDPESWEIKPGDRLFRLWTAAMLAMVAKQAELSEPEASDEHVLAVMHRL